MARPVLPTLSALLIAFGAAPAVADDMDIVPEVLQGPDLGKVVQSATDSSDWRIDADTGEVSLTSGDAMRVTSGPATPPSITIECKSSHCRDATLTAVFAPAGSGRATIVGFAPGTVTSHGLTLQSVSGQGTPHLIMTFLGGDSNPASVTFPLGLTVRLAPGSDAAASSYGYSLLVTRSP